MSTLVQIPFHGTNITAMSDEGKPLVSLRHVCDSLGIDADSQRKKLLSKPWACTVLNTVQVPGDIQARKWLMIDRRTMTMWLATIESSRVKAEAREMLEAFQNEAADALDSYFHEGGAINPNATEEQLDKLIRRSRGQMEIIALARGIVSDDYLDNQARIVIAEARGEKPVIAAEDMSLDAMSYLRGKKLPAKTVTSIRSTFGKLVTEAYRDHFGKEPQSAAAEVNGRTRNTKYYSERHRHLFDQVWDNYYAEDNEPTLMDELAA